MSREFELLNDRHQQLSLMHSNAVMAFSISKAIQKMKAPNILGYNEAQSNLSAMNRYKGAFMPFESMAGYSLYMTLARMFVANRDALTFGKLFDFIEQNQSSLKVDDFRSFYQDREYIEQLSKDFTGFSLEDVRAAKHRLIELEDIVVRLKTVRDEQLAHINLKESREVSVNHGEVRRLLECSDFLLNLVSNRYFHSTTMYHVIDDQSTSDVVSLIHLARLENENSRAVNDLLDTLGSEYSRDIDGSTE